MIVPWNVIGKKSGIKAGIVVSVLCFVQISGCTRESIRIAIEAQRRADQVQQAVYDRQHEALCILLYRDMLSRLGETGAPVSMAQRVVINEVWNERDLLEFWAVQQERSRALRLVGVDAMLASNQSIVDLLIKSVESRMKRIELKVAESAGATMSTVEP